jgi:transketolase
VATAEDALAALPLCVHTHIKDVQRRPEGYFFTPLGAGEIGCERIVQALAAMPLHLSIEIPMRLHRGPDAQPSRTDRAMTDDTLDALRHCAWRIRRYALRMGEVQGQGYIGQALGWADVLAVTYGHALKLRPAEPTWEGRDRFLLSHGHYAIAHYAALIEAGIVPEAELETYGSDDSRLPMSGMATYTPGMEMSGGSLGQGLPIAVGMALALRHLGNPAVVYDSMSDGELDEGSIWEAAMGAAHHQLGNLICLVDINNQQADGQILGFEPLVDKWLAFGWQVQRVDGNDLPAMIASIASDGQRVQAAPFGKALAELGAQRADIVGLSADLAKYTDLHLFAQARAVPMTSSTR